MDRSSTCESKSHRASAHRRQLRAALDREGGGWARASLPPAQNGAAPAAALCASIEHFGQILGTEQVIRLGFEANENPPVLGSQDQVEFHPAWHELMRLSVEHGLHALPWQCDRAGTIQEAAHNATPQVRESIPQDGRRGVLCAHVARAGESTARHTAERLALALQASLMIRYASNAESDAFCATRLSGAGHMFGTLP